MLGGHNENTKLLGFYADCDLVELVDDARGGAARSQFLREAAVEYMEARGVKVPAHLKNAPDRAGKGGPIKYRIPQANIAVDAVAKKLLKKAVSSVRKSDPK